MCEINTFVFFDTETTGLPQFGPTKLTELALIACSREHLLTVKNNEIPRILHKLLLSVNPMKLIALEATKITGLDNYMVENIKKFDENTVDLMNCFLKQLQKPVCLVAHNGNAFDYPILKVQLRALKCSLDVDLLCVDSLDIFKKIDQNAAMNEFLNSDLKTVQQINETTPARGSAKFVSRIPNDRPSSSRCLFPNDKSPTTEANIETSSKKCYTDSPKKRHSYKLIDIYQRLYGCLPENAHNAEADTMHLLKCAIAINENFVKLADGLAIKFE